MKLFGFGKSKATREAEAAAKRAQDVANAEAYKMGQDAASAMTGAVDHFVTFRARPVAEKVYGVFLKRIEDIRPSDEHSPIDLVRVDQKIFVEQLGEYVDRMKIECHEHIAEWLELADEMQTRDTLELYVSNQLSTIFMELFERSVNRSADVITAYKALGYQAILTRHIE